MENVLPADHKMIVCILGHGTGVNVIARLFEERGISTSNVTSGRGISASASTYIGNEGETEVDLLNVVVPTERADEIFNFIYDAANLNRPDAGLIFQYAISFVTPFELPEIK